MTAFSEFTARPCHWLRRFGADQSGAMSYLAVAGSLVMMVFGGIGIDLMYAELKRNKIQNTLDRAVLAAAALDNPMEAEAVVTAYFDAMDMSDMLVGVVIDTSAAHRQVSAVARTTMPSKFLSLLGVDTLQAEGKAGAEQNAKMIEISVVLDISSSMNRSNRLSRLKDAMEEFITNMVPEETTDSTSIISVNIVPYSLSVNPGPMSQYYTIDGKHDYRDCVWFENSHYDTLGIDPTVSLERYTHMADGSSRYNRDGTVTLPMCPDMAITPLETDRDVLLSAVDELRGWDGTGIDIGAKWGLHLLDPSFRPVANALIADGSLDASLSGRPFNYTDPNVKKIMILMSDGENDSQRDLHAPLRAGPSPVWQDTDSQDYSVLLVDGRTQSGFSQTNDGNSVWYHEDPNKIETHPDMSGAGGTTNWNDVAQNMVQLDWPDVFNVARTNDVYDMFFEKAYDEGYLTSAERNMYNNPLDMNRISENDTNQRLADICDLAHDQGVEIYGISFDPPSTLAQNTIRSCASSESHFFAVEGIEITEVFSSISRQVQQLRLYQ